MQISFDPKSYIDYPKGKEDYLRYKYDRQSVDHSDWYGRPEIGYKISRSEVKVEEVENCIPEIDFSILGSTFSVPNDLSELVEELQDSLDILQLENNWDMLGAEVIEPSLYLEATKFLLLYAIHIFKIHETILSAPEINPCRNGSIDFSWRTTGARMLINVRSKGQEMMATFYGYHKSNNLPIEGFIDMKKVDSTLALWMKELK